jgi:Thioredoxin domain
MTHTVRRTCSAAYADYAPFLTRPSPKVLVLLASKGVAPRLCGLGIATAEMVQTEADKLGVPVTIEKVTDYAVIAGYGILSTPGIVVDGKVVHAGGLPKPDDLAGWLAA